MTTDQTLLPARPSVYDRWRARVAADPALARRWSILAPLLVTLLAGILRLWNLGHPASLVFDETYYVKDAWSQWNLGYPATWPDGADESFVAGETDIFVQTGSFVVHPPLGKLLIGAGMWIFGADSSFGWRIAVAVFGTATVLLLYAVAKVLTESVVVATLASGLLAIDGLAISMSRIALLDTPLAFFVLLTFLFVLLDRRQHLQRLASGGAGTVFWSRPWLLAAGAAAGAATAVKWSGLYVLAAVGIYVVVTDALARRRDGDRGWVRDGMLQGAVAAVVLLPTAALVYLVSWTSWLVTAGGYGRDADTNPLVALRRYHQSIYGFHVGLSSPHGYASPAWQWPLLLRPTSMFYESSECGAATCVEDAYAMPNPLIWYASVAAAVYLLWRFARTRNWRYAFVLTGIAATYLPWLLYPERTIFFFYAVVVLPFLALALALALRDLANRPPGADAERRISRQRVVLVFLAFVLVLSVFWYPVVTATTVPYDFWRLHNWMPGWV